MCLETSRTPEKGDPTHGYGWIRVEVAKYSNGKEYYESPIFNTKVTKDWQRSRLHGARVRTPEYPCGFHICRTEADAKLWSERWGERNARIIRIEWKGALAFGAQWGANIVVARWRRLAPSKPKKKR